MPDKYIVPQFIDNEDKILGPITVRQFLIILGSAFVLFLAFKILALPYFIIAAVLICAFAGTFGFVKVNGQPFHIFFINFVQTSSRPGLRVWNKNLTDEEVRGFILKPPAPPMQVRARKEKPSSSRMRDLSLVVNTGGVFRPDDEF